MYLSFKDFCLIILKTMIWAIFIILLIILNKFNYNIGINFCKMMNIPNDFALTIVSPGMAIEVAICLMVFEFVIIGLIIYNCKKLKNIFTKFYTFISNIY